MIGQQLSHFRILSKIGEGGMGVVYEAQDLDLSRRVAIKVLPPKLVADPDRRKRFVSEARTAAAVTHANIATVYEIGEENGVIFIAMELIAGRSLRYRLKHDKPSARDAIRWAMDIAEGLAAAHQARIAHRDLKPDNIIITDDGHAKILDFGLARLILAGKAPAPRDKQSQTSQDASMTSAITAPLGDSKILGSPAYMSPEQARGQELDFRTDIFSFGSTLYEMLTGRPPFSGKSPTATIQDIVNKQPPAATSVNASLPSSVQWILDKCLEKDPSQRYQDTRDLVMDLRHVFNDTGTGAAPKYEEQLSANGGGGWRAAVAVGVVLVLAALAALGVFRSLSKSDAGDTAVATQQDANSVAVFEFDNLQSPEDPQRFGQIMQELLITDLSGLEPLKVFSSQRLSDVQEQINDGAKRKGIDKSTASRVAKKLGAGTMLTGSLSQLGESWIITAQLTDVESGTVLKSKRLDGTDLYAMVDRLTREIEQDFSLSRPTEIAAKPIAEKTTTSLQAWRHYLSGLEYLNDSQFSEAIVELTNAVQTDPKFGQAWYNLGIATWWQYSDAGAGSQHLEKLLSEKLYASERERRMAEGMLLVVKNQWMEALPVLEKLTHDFPDEKHAWYGRGEAMFHYPGETRILESRNAFEQAVALDPGFRLPYRHIFDVLYREKNYEEAKQLAQELITREPENEIWYRFHAASVAMFDDAEALEASVQAALDASSALEDKREIYRAVSERLAARGDLGAAAKYLEKGLKLDPDDPRLQRMLTGFYWDNREYEKLESLTLELLEREPENTLYLQDLFNVLMVQARYGEAHLLAQDLVTRQPNVSRWHRRLAQSKIYANSTDQLPAVIEASKVASSSIDDQRLLYSSIGWGFSSIGDYNNAIHYFKDAIALNHEEENPNLYHALSHQEFARGNFDASEKWLKRAQRIQPPNPESIAQSANISLARGQYERAQEQIEEAIAAAPPNRIFEFLKTSVLIMNDDFEAVEGMLKESETMQVAPSQEWEALYNRPGDVPLGVAWAYLLKGHDDLALESFQHGLQNELSNRDSRAHEGLGWTHLFRGEHDLARKSFEQALQIGYQHAWTYYALAANSLIQGKALEAEQFLHKARESGRGHVAIERMFGRTLAARKQWKQALDYAEKAVAMDSSRASLELLAWVLAAGELDVELGFEIAQKALELPVSHLDIERRLAYRTDAEHALGVAFMKQGDPDSAVFHLEKAAAVQPQRKGILQDLQRAREMPRGTH